MRTFILLLSFLFALPAYAADGLMVEGWARATASKAKNGAAYLTIKNNTDKADKLLSGRADAAKRTALHNHVMEKGVMKMRHVMAIDIPAKGMVMMKPGGLHVMLMGLKAPLVKGTTLPLTLMFQNAGEVTVEVMVMDMGAKGMGAKHGKMKH